MKEPSQHPSPSPDPSTAKKVDLELLERELLRFAHEVARARTVLPLVVQDELWSNASGQRPELLGSIEKILQSLEVTLESTQNNADSVGSFVDGLLNVLNYFRSLRGETAVDFETGSSLN
jgi:hypothetical protein